MQTIRELAALRTAVAGWHTAGETVALVPTMGALHAGHLALVAIARARADRVVASIFVNPRQFAPNDDLHRYPRRELADAEALTAADCDLLWLPLMTEMYPTGFATNVSVTGVSEPLDGAARPGHFDGVATVVTKLFNQVRPDVAIFGEKDFQQLAVIRRLNADLDFGIDIVGGSTARDADGLAFSSRNAYLTPADRITAAALPQALFAAAAAIAAGGDVAAILHRACAQLENAGFAVDYVELVDAETFGLSRSGCPRRLLAAAWIGGTRLIDNVPVA